MENYIQLIENFWQRRKEISKEKNLEYQELFNTIEKVLDLLDSGKIAVCEKLNGNWQVNEWIKKAILLKFITTDAKIYDGNCIKWFDKIDPKYNQSNEQILIDSKVRVVPGAFIRKGVYIGDNAVIMPSFINIGVYIGARTMIDNLATISSCAYIGSNCHLSMGVGIGGVLEPLQARPVIIEDNCFIGANSQIVEGVIVEEGSVIGMGVSIGSSTKIVDRNTGDVHYGKVPAYSVVVPGTYPAQNPKLPSLHCAVIIKKVDQNTRNKVGINELLRSG